MDVNVGYVDVELGYVCVNVNNVDVKVDYVDINVNCMDVKIYYLDLNVGHMDVNESYYEWVCYYIAQDGLNFAKISRRSGKTLCKNSI